MLAAASLTDVFAELAEDFEQANPGTEVTVSFGGSITLVHQVLDGAPADVLATADERTMAEVVEAGMVEGEPRVFAQSSLVLAVPTGNPGEVGGLDDLAVDERFVGLCAVDVPCGALATRLLEAAQVEASADTHEPDVRALLTKLAAGELDAGLVYRTDALAEDKVELVDVAGIEEMTTAYPLAVLAPGRTAAARAFADFVVGESAQAVLSDHGFQIP